MHPTESTDTKHQFSNRLANETSPYLRQHAQNPVDWYPWGPEALEKAKQEDKPILLSIGYSACHWCHVMERESFENEEIARVMNTHFVNIKVDREERPDLDTIYMNYVQMTTGSGGWPMTVFLTPDQIPFYGGTYFPPHDSFGRPGFRRLCLTLAEAYREKRIEIEAQGAEIVQRLRAINSTNTTAGKLTPKTVKLAFDQLALHFDMTHGGFSGAPKFPGSMNLAFLLRYYSRTGQTSARDFVELSLDKMAYGGMYDQLGGGFHRYSVDERWLVPHFEKMLYDNALLSRLYLEAYQISRKPLYRRIVEETLDYVVREMLSPNGGFYSTQDADSEGHEGKYFVWTPKEVGQVLGEVEGLAFCRFYDVTAEGNFEGENILNIQRPLKQVAEELRMIPQELSEILDRGRQQLFQERSKRIKPPRDEKILTSWNGMMAVSFIEAALVLQRTDYLEIAKHNVNFILKHLCRGHQIFRTHKDGQSKIKGYLDDYAHLVEALLALYQATGDSRWLEQAVFYNHEMLQQFWNADEKGFFLTGNKHEKLVTQVRDIYDNAVPAGNSVAVFNLLKLAVLTGSKDYRQKAEVNLEQMNQPLTRHPSGFGYLLEATDFYLGPVKEIVVVGDPKANDTKGLLAAIYRGFLPNKVVAILDPDQSYGHHLAETEKWDNSNLKRLPSKAEEKDSSNFRNPKAKKSYLSSKQVTMSPVLTPQLPQELPLLEGKTLVKGKPAVYVCQNYTCKAPVTEPSQLANALGQKEN